MPSVTVPHTAGPRRAIAVMGAGAVGCYYGALLARAGEVVTLIGRPALAQAVTAHGLVLDRGGTLETIALTAATDPAAIRGCDLVLVAVKSPDTAEAARAMAPHLDADATVVSLQNGVGNAERLSHGLGHPILPAVVYAALGMAGPGHVVHRGRGELVLGEGPGAAQAAQRFAAAGIPTQISADTETALWVKLTINCALNAVSALTRQPYARIIAHPDATPVFAAIIAECRAVACASGVTLPPDILEQVLRITRTMPEQRSSTAQDLIAGKRTEIAYLNGEIAGRAEALGLDAPLNRALTFLVTLSESP